MTDLPSLLRALAEPFVDPASRTFLPSLLLAAGVGLVWMARRGVAQQGWGPALREMWRRWRSGSSQVDLQLLAVRQLTSLALASGGLGLAWLVSTRVALRLNRSLGTPELPSLPDALVATVFSVVLFIAWDASRYLLHRLMHEVPALWSIHQVHHSADVLTPLTFFRIHPLEGLLYQLRGGLVTGVITGVAWWLVREQAVQHTLLGVHAAGLLLNATTGNLRHSHVYLSYGERIERWLISPAQHQLHHSVDTGGYRCNYGTWLSVWDRAGGTLVSSPVAPAAFGIHAAHRNHAPDDLIGALWRPLVDAAGQIRPRPLGAVAVVAALLFAFSARAEPSTDTEAPADTDAPPPKRPDDDAMLDVIVETNAAKVPRAAGSAHVVDEEALERFKHDDIHRVLQQVPGVYIRGEDGFGLRPNIGMRGANSDRSAKITLLEDGVLFAPAPYAAPPAYYFPMASRLTGVEVFKGPSATRFGPSTIGGAINLRTRRVPTDGPDGAIDVGVGMRDTVRLHGWGGVGGPRAGVLIEGAHLSTGGFKVLDDGGPTGFVRQEVMTKAFLASDPELRVRHRVELKAGYSREQSDETYLGLTPTDFAQTPFRRYAASGLDDMRWHRSQAQLSWRVAVGDNITVRTTAYHHYLTRSWFKLNRLGGGASLHDVLLAEPTGQAGVYQAILQGREDSVSPEQRLWIGDNNRQYHSTGLQTEGRAVAWIGKVRSETHFGARLHFDDVRRLHTEDAYDMRDGALRARTDTDTLTNRDSVARALALSAHISEDLTFGPLRVIPGARVEVIQTRESFADGTQAGPVTRAVPLPGLGIHGSVTPVFDLFAGVHRGFTPVPPGQDPNVRPESSVNLEAGLRLSPQSTFVELVGFFNDYANIAGQCTFSGGCTDAQVGQQFNGGAAHVYGAELRAAQAVPLGPSVSAEAELTYTFTSSRFLTGFLSGFPQFGNVAIGDRLPYVPEHQGAARFTVNHPLGDVSLAATGRSAMRDVAGQGVIPDRERIDAMAILDLGATLNVTPHVDTYLTIHNLTNTRYVESIRPYGLRPGLPFQAMIGVRAHPRRD